MSAGAKFYSRDGEVKEVVDNITKKDRDSASITINIPCNGLPEIAEALKHSVSLKKLELSGHMAEYNSHSYGEPIIDEADMGFLSSALKANTSIEEITLVKVSNSLDVVAGLADVLNVNVNIKSLEFNECIFQNKRAESEDASSAESEDTSATIPPELGLLIETLKHNTTLEKLTVTKLPDHDPRRPWARLPGDAAGPSLAYLNLALVYNAIAEIVKTNTSIKSLDLSGNGLTDATIAPIVEALKTNSTLTHLNVSGISGISESIVDLLEGANPSLTDLVYRSSSSAVIPVLEALEENTSLKSITLAPLNIKGMLALNKMLRANHSLTSLDLFSINWYSGDGLELKDAHIVILADALKANHTLKKLNLKNHGMGDVGAIELAEVLQSNESLEVLNLESNGDFRIGQTGVAHIAYALLVNHSLKEFDIAIKNVRDFGCQEFAKVIEENSSLTKLGIVEYDDSDSYEYRDDSFKVLATALKKNTTLTSFRSNYVFESSHWPDILKENKQIKELYGDTDLTYALEHGKSRHSYREDSQQYKKMISQIKDLLKRNQKLATLSSLTARVTKNDDTLTELKIDRHIVFDSGLPALVRKLDFNSQVKKLVLSCDQEIDMTLASALARVFQRNTVISHFSLIDMRFGIDEIRVIAEALAGNRSLTELYFKVNLSFECAKVLIESLQKNPSLLELGFYKTEFGDAGAVELAHMLKENTSLEYLNLDGNKIGAEGLTAIVEALESHTQLQEIDLENNRISNAGATLLAEMLKKHSSITSIHLRGNFISSEGAARLADALEHNPKITTMQLSIANGRIKKRVVDLLERNKKLMGIDASEPSAAASSHETATVWRSASAKSSDASADSDSDADLS